jgi:hypothetical protein
VSGYHLLIQVLLVIGPVSATLGTKRVEERIELVKVPLGNAYMRTILHHSCRIGGTRNRDNYRVLAVVRQVSQPGKRNLSGCTVVTLSNTFDLVHELEIVFKIVLMRSIKVCEKTVFGNIVPRLVPASKEASTNGGISNNRDPELFAYRKYAIELCFSGP